MGKFGQDASLQAGLRVSVGDTKIGAASEAHKASECVRLAATQPSDHYHREIDDDAVEAQCWCMAALTGLLCCCVASAGD